MTLSLLAAVSKDAGSSFGRKQPEETQQKLGQALLAKVFGNAEARRDFASRLSGEAAQQLHSLASESNPDIFFPDLLNFALRLEESGKSEAAAHLFLAMAGALEDCPEGLAPLREQAIKNYQALTGQSCFGPRAELLLQKFCKDATDPAALIAMGVGTGLFRFGRLWTAARFSRAGLIPEATALGGGFFAETAGFTLSHKLVSSAMGRPQDWSRETLTREWASGALVLGSLKFMGAAGRHGVQGAQGPGNLGRLARESGLQDLAFKALPQFAMYTGVVLGHHLQEFFGLREKSGQAANLADSLATLLQLNVGGGLMAAAAGKGYRRGLVESELRFQNWKNLGIPNEAPGLLPTPLSLLSETPYRDPAERPLLMLMEGKPRDSATERHKFRDGEEMLEAVKFLVNLPLPAKQALSDIYHSENGQLKLGHTLRQHSFTDKKAHELALCRLGYAIKHARAGKAEGGYFDWLLRTVFEDIVDKTDGARADRILHFLAEGGSIHDFEAMLAKDLPDLSINRFAAWLPEHWKAKNPNYALIQGMPLPQDLRNILFRYSHTQARAQQPSPYFQSETELMDAVIAHQWNRMGLIRGVLETAAKSPLGILRLKRMTQLFNDPERLDDFTDQKLLELADPGLTLLGAKPSTLPHSRFRTSPSQFNAYLGEGAPEALLHEIQKRLPDLLDPKRAEQRLQRRKEQLKMLETHQGRFGTMERPMLAAAFQLLGDPYSKKIAKSLGNNEFDVRVLSNQEFEAECRRLSSRIEPERSSAQFFPAGHGRDRGIMLIRERPFDHYSSEVAPDALFTVMGKIAHEYQHYLDMHPKLLGTARNRLLIEMSAHLRDALWKAEHGDPGKLGSYARDGIGGLALHFRNEFEQIYGGIYKE